MRRTFGKVDQVTKLDSESDEKLVAKIGDGDARAFQVLMNRHVDLHISFAERLVGNRAEAEDIIQDAYTKLWTNGKSFNPEKAKFTTWFYRVIMNRCFDHKRRKKPLPLADDFDAPDPAASAHQTLEARERTAKVQAALDQIPKGQKAAIMLCYFQEVSNKEAAEILGLNLKALESLLSRGRKNLQDFLELDV